MKDKWIPLNVGEAAEALGCDPVVIETLTRIPIARNDGGCLINLKQFKDYLLSVEGLASHKPKKVPAEKASVKKIKAKTEKPPKKNFDGWIPGAKAAKTLGCEYADIIKLIEDGVLKGQKKGQGWLIEPKSLESLMAKREGLAGNAGQGDNYGTEKPLKEVPARSPEPTDTPDDNPEKGATGTEPNQDDAEANGAGEKSSPGDDSLKPVIIATGKYGCTIEDVAAALGKSPFTVREWIGSGPNKVKAIDVEEGGKITLYLDQDSLKAFLDRYHIAATFEAKAQNRKTN